MENLRIRVSVTDLVIAHSILVPYHIAAVVCTSTAYHDYTKVPNLYLASTTSTPK